MTFIIHPVILCGGSGSRLWPLSTPSRPKQFRALTSSKSMIRETSARFQTTNRNDLNFARTLVVGSKQHESLLESELPMAKKILEPFGRNSAPAVAAAAIASNPDALLLILPADHEIIDVPAFHDAIAIAAVAAQNGAIITFGIEPTHPATGYGYIKTVQQAADSRAIDVEAFVEKPDLDTARNYVSTGTYFWNAGIFLFKASAMLDALGQYAPDVLESTKAAMGERTAERVYLDADAFALTPSISIDYAVMENSSNIKTVPVSMGWSDVGGYRALHELLASSPSDNYTNGPVHVQNSKGLYVRSEGPVITVHGASDLVIVATKNEVIITPKSDDAAVKQLGRIAQNDRHALGCSTQFRERARNWLWTAFETWSENAWDDVHRGFIEQLDMTGAPDRSANRRVRVQARQVYSFAKAIELGWSNQQAASALVEKGLEYIDNVLRHPDGGWVHIVEPTGAPVDSKRDLYDHAFIVLAGAAAYKACGNVRGLAIADEALEFIHTEMSDAECGGWHEAIPPVLPRRSNPHMHILEAMLEYHQAIGGGKALETASEVVGLFESRFFNPRTNVMAEFFSASWQVDSPTDQALFEPGHHYEWATLLKMHDEISNHDSGSWQRRLIQKANKIGLNSNTGFAFNSVRADGVVTNDRSRLWHQLEMFRAYLYHPEISSRDEAEHLFEHIRSHYLDPAPVGMWIDELDSAGNAVSSAIPASMLYHFVTALLPIVQVPSST